MPSLLIMPSPMKFASFSTGIKKLLPIALHSLFRVNGLPENLRLSPPALPLEAEKSSEVRFSLYAFLYLVHRYDIARSFSQNMSCEGRATAS